MVRYPNKAKRLDSFEYGEKLISRGTPIASMGSCFATHIGRKLVEWKFNYLVYEPEVLPQTVASAHWDFVYNTACMRQIFEYSFGDWEPKERWWSHNEHKYVDPYRRNVLYNRREAYKKFNLHRRKSRAALQDAEVLILTLGLTETWRHKKDHATFYRRPFKVVGEDHEFHIQNVSEVILDLELIYQIMLRHNPEVKIIFTVSPVPFNATYRTDIDVVSANCASKSTLRVGVNEFVHGRKNLYYFPSYEIAQEIDDRWRPDDGRHMKWEVIDLIMEVFKRNWTTED